MPPTFDKDTDTKTYKFAVFLHSFLRKNSEREEEREREGEGEGERETHTQKT